MADDRTYAVRQLVDVSLKALSPGVNDPTTAQDAIVHLGTLLVHLLSFDPDPTGIEDEGHRRVLIPEAVTDAAVAELALAELRRAAADNPAVCRYLLAMVADVVEAVGRERTVPLLAQAELLLVDVEQQRPPTHDLALVRDDYERWFGPIESHADDS